MQTDKWQPDILPGYEKIYVKQPDDSNGPVRCTVVRRLCKGSRCAAVYIHGFSDYFFQTDLGREFVEHGFSFYAVDLRRYGRSIMPGQRRFVVRSMSEYFPDIQAGIDAAKAGGASEIALIGHSTGGLSTTLYMEMTPDPAVRTLILNSPFLAWNVRPRLKRMFIPVIGAIGRIFPNITVHSGGTIDYHRSLARDMNGEWEFDTRWKQDIMPDVDAGWVGAIDRGQRRAAGGTVKVPVLLMHSDKSAWHGDSDEAFSSSDGVLDVDKISGAGKLIGPRVTDVTIPDGLHDLVLSRPDVRSKVYETIFWWLGQVMPGVGMQDK